jgi:TRAP-type transport system small permease protein
MHGVDEPLAVVPRVESGAPMSPLTTGLTRISFAAGCTGLLLAMLVDASAVFGRHLGLPLRGSIEVMRACVVVFASSALVGTSLAHGHASVHMLTEHLPSTPRRWLQRTAALASALFFGVLALGSCVVVRDLWHGPETSELLQLPLMPLRLFWCASALTVVLLFTATAFARRATLARAANEPGTDKP